MRAACQMNHSNHSSHPKHTRNLSHSKVKNFYELGKIIILWLKNIYLRVYNRHIDICVYLYIFIYICVYIRVYICLYVVLLVCAARA